MSSQPTAPAKLRRPLAASTVLAAALTLLATPALAHTGQGVAGGFTTGFMHPITGPDHVVAMVAVGMWGAFLGAPAIWLLPIVFPLVMAFGGVLGVVGVPMPGVEIGIALSAIGLGLVVAIFHGYAHGAELPQATNAIAYSIGFVLATGLLHLCGISFGLLVRWPIGERAVRTTGGLITCAGVYFLLVGT
jgi:urease accessory protein